MEELNPLVVQIVRSVVQSLWAAALGLGVFADVIESTGLDPQVAQGAAIGVAMFVVLVAVKALNRVNPIFGWLLSGINRPPEYGNVTPKDAKTA